MGKTTDNKQPTKFDLLDDEIRQMNKRLREDVGKLFS
jgi:hypothetical protein